jgi:menaquinone-9 beta-reductase
MSALCECGNLNPPPVKNSLSARATSAMVAPEVLIAGGGPAGLAAGIVLARAGIPTLIVDRQTYPIDKACGEGLMPTGAAALQRLGVLPRLDLQNTSPIRGIRYISSGVSARASFREGPGLGVRRTALSSALLEQAQSYDCLEVRPGTRLNHLERQPGAILAQVGEESLSVRLIIGADGLNSGVRRWAGLDQPAPALQRYGARQHFAAAPWSEDVEVYWNDGLEAYITPTGPRQVGAAFLWDRARFRPPTAGRALIQSLLEQFPTLHARLAGAPLLSQPRAAGPFWRNVKSPVGDGVLLLGDAAGYVDALTGEGISLALQSALLLETTVVPHLTAVRGSRVPTSALEQYRRGHARLMAPYTRMARLALFFSHHPRLLAAALYLLERQPWIFSRLLSANMGRAPF